MKALIQRVTRAEVKVEGISVSAIEQGYLIFLGVAKGDREEQAEQLAKKISTLRIFVDENGKINRSILDVGGEVLAVSQFTLLANASHGNRPDFLEAEAPDRAEQLYDLFCAALSRCGVSVKRGVFGADMKIDLLNDGPFTIMLEK